jgi:glycosyltransferase involved in cell wall biosynthesis
VNGVSSGFVSDRPLRVCRVVTVPLTFATLLRRQIECIAEAGIDLTLVSNPGEDLDAIAARLPRVQCHGVPMTRNPSPLGDIRSLWELCQYLRRNQFDIVHSSTPKAGLLTALAGAISRTPLRLHTFTGQVWAELHGPVRGLLRSCDRLIGRLSSFTYADSVSQMRFLITGGVVRPEKISVLGAGSISGVDLGRFEVAQVPQLRAAVRRNLGLREQATVIVFLGRVTRDKGIVELTEAFSALRKRHSDLALLLVGPFEGNTGRQASSLEKKVAADPNIRVVGFVPQPEGFLAAADVFCLPSYREGFGSVVIEAAALGIPAVATRVTGLVDAVVDGVTGLLVPPRDPLALGSALERLIVSPQLRRQLGQAARERAVALFDASNVNSLVINEYFRLATGLSLHGRATVVAV